VLRVSDEELKQAVHVFTLKGATLKAARALRFVALRLPLTAPAAALLFLPGVLSCAERLYGWLSRHRHRLVARWTGTTCDSNRL
jgi:hypothetical protein